MTYTTRTGNQQAQICYLYTHTCTFGLPYQSIKLTDSYHEVSEYLVPLVRGRVALDAAVRPEIALADFRIVFASERL